MRALFRDYAGKLYQVQRGDKTTKDIGVAADGFADAVSQEAFCSGSTCTISILYDQSPKGNHLTPAPAGGAAPTPDNPANAADLKVTVGGHNVYGIRIWPGMGYRNNHTSGIAIGDEAETEYMLTSQKDLVGGCCFDYGNAETDNLDDGGGTMEAIYFGTNTWWGSGINGGPWVMADLENGLFAGVENNQNKNISTNTPLWYDFVTTVLVGRSGAPPGSFALLGGDATSGPLRTMYDGPRPPTFGSDVYSPQKKQGAIILGIGGDNSKGSGGRFYEGVMTNGAATQATLDALQANIVAAGYGSNASSSSSSSSSSSTSGTPNTDPTLILHYNFDDGTGTTAADSSGNHNDGTLQGTATWADQGHVGGALLLDGNAGTFVTLPASIIDTYDSVTIAAWVNLIALDNWARLIDFGSAAYHWPPPTPTPDNGYMFFALTDSANMHFEVNNASNNYTAAVVLTNRLLSPGDWHHVAMTVDPASGYAMWSDGQTVASLSFADGNSVKISSLAPMTTNYIGKSHFDDAYLRARIDDFRIYNRALSASEMADLAKQ